MPPVAGRQGPVALFTRHPDTSEHFDEVDSRLNRTNQAILDGAQEGIYGLDPRGFVTFTNVAARRLTGWSPEDVRGHTQHSLVHHSHEDGSPYPQDECPIYQAMRDGRTYSRDDEVFWRKDGTCFPVSYTSTPVLRDGEPYGAIVVFTDITDRAGEGTWRASKNKLLCSIADRRPLRETLARLTDAFGSLFTVPVPSARSTDAGGC